MICDEDCICGAGFDDLPHERFCGDPVNSVHDEVDGDADDELVDELMFEDGA